MAGKLVVIEGLDGSGKSTQITLLKNLFDERGIKNKFIHFPMMNQGIYGTLIAEFLRGEFGSVECVHPKLVALLFANDRKENIQKVEKWLQEGYIVFADRYVNSNIAFQCAKVEGEVSKTALKEWILQFEFHSNNLPLPHKSVYLDVPFSFIEHSLTNSRTGEDRDYLDGLIDIHEDSLDLQMQVMAEYKKMIGEQPSFVNITCTNEHGTLMSPQSINAEILAAMELNL